MYGGVLGGHPPRNNNQIHKELLLNKNNRVGLNLNSFFQNTNEDDGYYPRGNGEANNYKKRVVL